MPSRRAAVKAFLSVERSCNSNSSLELLVPLRAANRAASSTVHSRRGAARRRKDVIAELQTTNMTMTNRDSPPPAPPFRVS
eukprot:2916946-Prymnesium_polylepis.1